MNKKYIIVPIALVAVILYFIINGVVVKTNQDYLEYNTDPFDKTVTSDLDYFDSSDYYTYLENNIGNYPAVDSIIIPGIDYVSFEGEHEVLTDYEGVDSSLLTNEEGTVTWNVQIEEAGYYNFKLNYYPYEGKSSMIERTLYINGEIPFKGASNITFHRIWGSVEDIKKDVNGNEIRPSQVEIPAWTESYFRDQIGYINEPYQFYLEAGENSITLESVREPMLIDSIELTSIEPLHTYTEMLAEYQTSGYKEVGNTVEILQAEEFAYSSSPTIYPLNDRTSAKTIPSSPTLVRLNTIGGNNWRIVGDAVVWEFTVPETGLYEISMRLKQKMASGMSVSRNIYINGEIPFEELVNYSFKQSNEWRTQSLGNEDEAYLFYFEAGVTNTMKMEVSLGYYGPIIGQVQSSIAKLNKLYREILIYTGPEPDIYRDYQLTERVDNLVERLEEERDNLTLVRKKIIEIAGTKSDKTGIIDTVLLQLDDFIKKPREIHQNLLAYNSNISSLGTLVILLSSQPLEIDYFAFGGVDAELPQSKASSFEQLLFDMKGFGATFTTDYSSLGETENNDSDETIEVWLSVGRDQANILRKMIDESFTPETGIKVDLKLVNGSVLLPATLANVGPDVAMGLGNSIPVNYAMRNAVHDLSTFDDFEEVTTRFQDSAIVPFEYEDGYYALPEQQVFLMMFYRTDIFEELGLTAPNTWDEVIKLIPDLQKHNLEFYLPVPITQGGVMNLPPNPIYSTLFYQNDGEFYVEGNTMSGFDLGKGPEVFEMWTKFYTDYSFPVQANFLNRFRSGQMPIGISYYNTYNSLSVFAPEIRGKWDFVPMPGTLVIDEDGNESIRRETVSSGTGAMIMDTSEHKDASWEYLKWWTESETQVRFGRELEGILGAAARYPTANIEALSQLPWTVKEYQKLEEQWEWVVGIPEVPGGYMTGRHLDNAFRLVLEDSSNPRETIYDYVRVINDEMLKKRREFGLE